MFGLFCSSKSRRDAQAYADDLRQQLKEGARQGQSRLQNFRDTAYEQAQRFAEPLDEHRRRAQELTLRGARNIDDQAHENPWAYVAAGTAIGLALGYFIGRR